jgi:preprotein translocase subunit YajC
VPPLLIIGALFVLLYVVMIRPQKAKAQRQQRMLSAVEPGDEILTVGGIYGIVQEIEPDEDGGDLVVEIAEGIHVRIARKALATVIKPEDEDEEDEEDDEQEEVEGGDQEEPEAVGGVAEVNGEVETVNPGAVEEATSSERS